jgi:hypothetical protein
MVNAEVEAVTVIVAPEVPVIDIVPHDAPE